MASNIEYRHGSNGQFYGIHTVSNQHYVYAHVNPKTNETFYIGLGKGNRCNQAAQRNQFWKRYVEKHGMKVKILRQGLTKSEAADLEKALIKQMKPRCNLTFGGELGDCGGTPVFSFSKEGVFHKGFRTISDANAYFNVKLNDSRIVRCLSGERQIFKGFMWSKEPNKPPTFKAKKKAPAKQVHEYDLDGKWKSSYESPRDANVPTRTGIYVCLDKPLTYAGSFWRSFKVDRLNELPPTPALIASKKVICLQSGQIFDSISKAAKHINMPHQTLIKRLNGKLKNNTGLQFYAEQKSNHS